MLHYFFLITTFVGSTFFKCKYSYNYNYDSTKFGLCKMCVVNLNRKFKATSMIYAKNLKYTL